MNDFQHSLVRSIGSSLKTALCEAFDFDGQPDEDYSARAAAEIARDLRLQRLRDTLYGAISKNISSEDAQMDRDTIDQRCVDSHVEVAGARIPSLRYNHLALAGREFLIPGDFSEINYGRKNDKMAKYRGDVHWKDVPKPMLEYAKKIEGDPNFNAVRVSVKCNMIAAIDKSKMRNPEYPDNRGCQWDIWEVPTK